MGKAIIITTPAPTHGEVQVVLSDDPKYPQDSFWGKILTCGLPPGYKVNDIVEITITSDNTCDIVRKITPTTANITSVANPQGGMAKVTSLPDPNEFRVDIDAEFVYSFLPPAANPLPMLFRNDSIQVILKQANLGYVVKALK